MKTKEELFFKRFNTGIIVGRFQVPELTSGHKELIQSVIDRHDKVFVIIGVTNNNEPNVQNPLPYDVRCEMLLTEFPQVKVVCLMDEENDEEWVKSLDKTINTITSKHDTITLYGGRDSFIQCYANNKGKYNASELVPTNPIISGSAVRAEIARKTINTTDFRRGIIFGVLNMS